VNTVRHARPASGPRQARKGSMIDDDIAAEQGAHSDARNAGERRTLQKVLGINLGQCAAGAAVGVWAMSTALIGAALDNLADAAVYALSLYAIGRSPQAKVRAARLSGWLLIGLSMLLLLEVFRRFFGGEPPIGAAMISWQASTPCSTSFACGC